ncbi:hypothetical protein ACFVHW_06770 [Streptomyces sp. NPDC127110]|uniref:hypothetical protein n=1 Tax=Streptomyces sp. NPDC127110 TaxID=3345362 RepID=UPI00363C81DA
MNVSSLPADAFPARLEEAGLTVLHRQTATFQPDSRIAGPEEHVFLRARRTGRVTAPAHALLGPYPHPARYRGPHTLSTDAWAAFEPHFPTAPATRRSTTAPSSSRPAGPERRESRLLHDRHACPARPSGPPRARRGGAGARRSPRTGPFRRVPVS